MNRIFRKCVSIMLVMTMLLSMAPPSVFASEEDSPAGAVLMSEENPLEYTSGFYTYTRSNLGATITGYSGRESALVIPSALDGHRVVAIGNEVFSDMLFIKSVTLPDTLRELGWHAFAGDKALKSVSVPASLKRADHPFEGCVTLSTVSFAAGTECIPASLFSGSGLSALTIPDSVEEIGENAFSGCEQLEELSFGSGLKRIGSYAFENCDLITELTLPEGLEELQYHAFAYTDSLEKVTLPASLRSASAPFEGCDQLCGITLSGAPEKIFNSLFRGTGVTEITIPDSVAVIESYAFADCYQLSAVRFGSGLKRIGDSAFENCDLITELTLPEGLEELQFHAFAYMDALEKVTLPASLRTVNYPFEYCGCLTEITLSGAPEKILSSLYRGTGITEITIPDSVTEIENYAFSDCYRLSAVRFGSGLKRIGDYAFSNCDQITELTLPEGLEELSYHAFCETDALEKVTLPASLRSVNNPFEYCGSLNEITLAAGIERIPDSLFYGVGITEFTIPDSVTEIGDHAFYGCQALSSVRFGSGLKRIGNSAFSNCGLTALTIPDTVTEIGEYAFSYCDRLTEVTLPEGLEELGYCAFGYSDALEAVSIPSTLVSGSSAFAGCGALKEVTFGPVIYEIPDSLFESSGIEELVLPDTVARLGNYAFAYCGNLTALTVPENVLEIDVSAFYGSDSLTVLCQLGSTAEAYCTERGIPQEAAPAPGSGVSTALSYVSGYYTYTRSNLGATITGYSGNESTLVIPSTLDGHRVVAIGNEVFSDMLFIKSVTLPDTLRELGWHAFSGDKALKTVYVPASLKRASYPFEGCITLNTVSFGAGIAYIPAALFSGSGLSALAVPDSVEEIGENAFSGCEQLEELSFGSGLKRVGSYAFENCDLITELTLPEGLEELQYRAFAFMDSLEKVSIPASLQTVSYPFEGCGSLRDVTLASGLRRIPGSLYYGSGITEITIPDSVTVIENDAFGSCGSLTSVRFGSGLRIIGEHAFQNCDQLTELTLPEGLEELQYNAFAYMDALEKITLPASLQTVSYPFEGCDSLRDVTPVSGFRRIPNSLYFGSGITEITIPDSVSVIEGYAFGSCRSLTSVRFGSGLRVIGEYAFQDCDQLTELVLPEGLEELPYHAFAYMDALEKVTLPASLQTVNYPFEGCGSLCAFTLADGTERIPGSLFSSTGVTEITIPDSVTEIGDYAFYGCQALTSVRFGSGLTRIGAHAFRNCGLTAALTLPDSVTEIGEAAFAYCGQLPAVSFGSGLRHIGSEAFYECGLLTEAALPEGLEELGYRAFGSCDMLERAVIPSTLAVGSDAFFGCAALSEVTFGEGIYELPYALLESSGLEELELPSSVAKIGDYAFAYCDKLLALTVPDSVLEIGWDTFYGAENLTVLCYPDTAIETYCTEHDIPLEYLVDSSSLTLIVTDPDGEALDGGYTVEWYRGGAKLSEGNRLHGYSPEQVWYYRIVLGEALAKQYIEPSLQAAAAAENGTIRFALTVLPTLTVSGQVTAEDGTPVSGAEVSFTQFFGSFSEVVTVTTDRSGGYTASLHPVETSLLISSDAYFDYEMPSVDSLLSAQGAVTLKEAVLKPLTKNRLTMSLLRVSAAPEGEAAGTEPTTDTDGLSIRVFRSGGSEVTGVTVRYPYLFLPADLPSETLRVEIADTAGALTFQPNTVTLDAYSCGSFTAAGTENGYFRADGLTGRVLVFDGNGILVSAYRCEDGFRSDLYPDGDYTLVVFAENGVLRTVASLAALHALNIESGKDYLELSGSIRAGRITDLSIPAVPTPDITKLRYTVASSTELSASRTSSTIGRPITLKAQYEIESRYPSADETITLRLPQNVHLVEGSVTLDGVRSVYDLNADSNTLTVAVGAASGVVRCIVIQTEAGTDTIDALLSFASGGTVLSQQLGSVSLTADTLAFQTPEKTGQRKIKLSGTGVAESEVSIYDNGVLAAQTTVKRGGSWAAELTLSGAEDLYAVHQLTAELRSEKYGFRVSSEPKAIVYDPNYLSLSKITMINTAHTGETVEFVTVCDYLNPSGERLVYNYWPAYPTFTFKVEFTRNDPERISNVRVITAASDGTLSEVPCTYDERLGLWVGTHDYPDSQDKPARITAAYDCEEYGGDLPIGALYRTEDLPGLLERVYYADRDGFMSAGMFGLGWYGPFDLYAEQHSDENGGFVVLRTATGAELFEADADGVYREVTHGLDTASVKDGCVSVRYADGTQIAFSASGWPVSVSSPDGGVLTLEYNSDDLPVRVSDGGEQALLFRYEDGKAVSAVFGEQTVNYTYDGDYLVAVTTDAGTERYTYHTDRVDFSLGALASVTTVSGAELGFGYDAYGRISEISNGSAELRYRYTGENTVLQTDSAGNTVQLDYENGILRSIEDLTGGTVSFDYDEFRIRTVEFADGAAYRYRYDENGSLSSVEMPDGGAVCYVYENGNLRTVTDQLGSRSDYSYDADGRILSIGWADGTDAAYVYGDSGELLSLTQHDGSETQMRYNEQGLLSAMTYPDGTETGYLYDANGNLTGITEGGETTLIGYDTVGNVSMVVYPDGKTVSYTYDSQGRTASVTDSAGFTTRYHYAEDSGLPVLLTDDSGRTLVEYVRNEAGLITRQLNANGTYTDYGYTGGLPTSIVNRSADGSVLSSFVYTYDGRGNILSKTTIDGTWSYTYDGSSRLTGSTAPDGSTLEYRYDAAGNRTAVIAGGAETTYTLGGLNRYSAVGGEALSWDQNGALTAFGGESYIYDARGRLIRYESGGNVYEYGYDAFGNRSSVTVNGETTDYVYDPMGGGSILTAYAESGVTSYIYGAGLAAQTSGGETCFYDFDVLGSTAEITDSEGSVVNRYAYSDCGIRSRQEQLATPFTYAGRYGIQDDGSALSYVRSRYLHQELGRFLSPDTAGSAYDVNLYTYAGNNPVSCIDIDGEFVLTACLTVVGISAAVGVGGQAISDLVETSVNYHATGEWNWTGTVGGYVGAAASGALTGAVTYFSAGTLTPVAKVLTGAGGGFVQSTIRNAIDHHTFDVRDTAINTALGGLFSWSPISDRLEIRRIPVLNKGWHSWDAGYKRMITNIAKNGWSYRPSTIIKNTIRQNIADFVSNLFKETGKDLLKSATKSPTKGPANNPFKKPNRKPANNGNQPKYNNWVMNTIIKYFPWMDLTGIDDPSGYVFEAVDSNRLEGVTATAYTKEEWLDDFGQHQEEIVFWESEEYDQSNPLITDSYGRYAWDVPEGQWQVKYEKEGYETAYSAWLPVPPPQTEINIGMISYAAPEIRYITADSQGVTVAFTKYMNPATVDMTVSAAGAPLSGEVTALDLETNSNTGAAYASLFRYAAAGPIAADAVRVTVSGASESYAGTKLGADYESAVPVTVVLTGFSVTDELILMAGHTLEITVSAIPEKIGAGKAVSAVSKSPSIISVTGGGTTGLNGAVPVTITGELPGQGFFTVSAPDTDVTASFSVIVLDAGSASDYCAANGHSFTDGLCTHCGEADPDWLTFAVSGTVPAGSLWYAAEYDSLGRMLNVSSGSTAYGQSYVAVGKKSDYVNTKVVCFFLDPISLTPLCPASVG